MSIINRVAELEDQIETEQHLVNVFKLELQAKQEELVEKDRDLQKMAFFELVFFIIISLNF